MKFLKTLLRSFLFPLDDERLLKSISPNIQYLRTTLEKYRANGLESLPISEIESVVEMMVSTLSTFSSSIGVSEHSVAATHEVQSTREENNPQSEQSNEIAGEIINIPKLELTGRKFTIPRYPDQLNEDRCELILDPDGDTGVCAVADGVGQSGLASECAEALVEVACKNRIFLPDQLIEAREEIRAAFFEKAGYSPGSYEPTSDPRVIFGRRMLKISMEETGGAATLSSVVIEKNENGRMVANVMNIGDTVVIVRQTQGSVQKIKVFPSESVVFSKITAQIGITHDKYFFNKESSITNKLLLVDGDVVIVATDGIANFILANEDRSKAIDEICALSSDEDYISYVESARKNGQEPDDATLVRIIVNKKKGA